jgi:prephenate dehydrogenase
VRWKKVSLIGVGLLGGSLGQAIKSQRLAEKVVGYVRRELSITECLEVGAVDSATLDLAQAVQGADLIVLCTPIAQMAPLLRQALSSIKPGAVVTDVGSVKLPVVAALEKLCRGVGAHFIGSHPMAGAEKMGVKSAHPGLFKDAVCVVTPTKASDPAALRKVRLLWRRAGCRLMELDPGSHDRLVAQSSHLPHVVAANLTNLVLRSGRRELADLCANGFRDTTRIASGSPEMWRDIALANHRHLGPALDAFIRNLARFRQALKRGDEPAIRKFFEQAKVRRDAWVNSTNRSKTPE